MNIEIVSIVCIFSIILLLMKKRVKNNTVLDEEYIIDENVDIPYKIINSKNSNDNIFGNINQPNCKSKINFLAKKNLPNVPNNIKSVFNKIIVKLFCDLRKKGFRYKLLEYETGKVINFNNNIRFIMNVFVYNENTQVSKKVEIDLILFKNKDIKILSISNGKSLDNLENLPKSTQSNINRKTEYDNLDGKLDSSLEYTLLNTEIKIVNNEIICDPKINVLNKKGFSSFPCKKQTNFWDNNGINKVEEDSQSCFGVNATNRDRVNILNGNIFNKNKTDYRWMFKLDNGDNGFPRGGFNKV